MATSLDTPITPTSDTLVATLDPAGNATARQIANLGFNDHVDVRNYGAIGDGAADDTAAIQAAIDTARPVFIPQGVFRTTSALKLKYIGQGIFGAGPVLTEIFCDFASGNGIEVEMPGGTQAVRDVIIRDLTIYGQGDEIFPAGVVDSSVFATTGIYAQDPANETTLIGTHFILNRVHVHSFSRGFFAHQQPLLYMENSAIMGCNLQVDLAGVDQFCFINCLFQGWGTIGDRYVISLEATVIRNRTAIAGASNPGPGLNQQIYGGIISAAERLIDQSAGNLIVESTNMEGMCEPPRNDALNDGTVATFSKLTDGTLNPAPTVGNWYKVTADETSNSGGENYYRLKTGDGTTATDWRRLGGDEAILLTAGSTNRMILKCNRAAANIGPDGIDWDNKTIVRIENNGVSVPLLFLEGWWTIPNNEWLEQITMYGTAYGSGVVFNDSQSISLPLTRYDQPTASGGVIITENPVGGPELQRERDYIINTVNNPTNGITNRGASIYVTPENLENPDRVLRTLKQRGTGDSYRENMVPSHLMEHLATDISKRNNTGATKENATLYTLRPRICQENGERIRFSVRGRFAANGNSKTISFMLNNADQIVLPATTASDEGFHIEVDCIYTLTNRYDLSIKYTHGSTTFVDYIETLAVGWVAGGSYFGVGLTGVATDDIVIGYSEATWNSSDKKY